MGDVGEAEAEAVVLQGTGIMMTAHKLVGVVVLGEEEVVVTLTATVTEAGGPEVGVLDADQDVAEAREGRETGVQLGKEVLKEGQRLNNGIEKKNKQNLVLKPPLVKTIMITSMMMVLYIM